MCGNCEHRVGDAERLESLAGGLLSTSQRTNQQAIQHSKEMKPVYSSHWIVVVPLPEDCFLTAELTL